MVLAKYKPAQRKLIVDAIKGALLYKELLKDFERDFMSGFAYRYSKFGDRLNVEPKQFRIFKQVHKKLML